MRARSGSTRSITEGRHPALSRRGTGRGKPVAGRVLCLRRARCGDAWAGARRRGTLPRLPPSTTAADRVSEFYREGISCAHCHDRRSDEDRERYAERRPSGANSRPRAAIAISAARADSKPHHLKWSRLGVIVMSVPRLPSASAGSRARGGDSSGRHFMLDPKKLLDDLLGSKIPGTESTVRDGAGRRRRWPRTIRWPPVHCVAVLLGTGTGASGHRHSAEARRHRSRRRPRLQGLAELQERPCTAQADAGGAGAVAAAIRHAFHPSQAPQGENEFALTLVARHDRSREVGRACGRR